MNDQQTKHLSELLTSHRKRLDVLELQSAKFGLYTPAHITLEIEEIVSEIQKISLKLNYSSESTSNLQNDCIRVLFLCSDPTDASRLRLQEEVREIQNTLQLSKLRDKFIFSVRTSIRPSDLSQSLLDIKPNIVHFSGHGNSLGEIYFETQDGKAFPVSPDALSLLFKSFSLEINCIILNACYSEIQAISISKYINYLIGMQAAIGDKAAIAFSVGFYQAIGAGRNVEDSFELGRIQVGLYGIPEHQTPILIKK